MDASTLASWFHGKSDDEWFGEHANTFNSQLCVGGWHLSLCRSELMITVAPIAIRAAFSNIHTWTVLIADLQLAGQVRPEMQHSGNIRGTWQVAARHLGFTCLVAGLVV